MKKVVGIKQYLFLIIVFVFSFLFVFISHSKVHAKNDDLPFLCEQSKGIYEPTDTLILVELDDILYRLPGESVQESSQKLLYELSYVRGNKISPFNAILTENDLVYISCDYLDYQANIISEETSGLFIVGIFGHISSEKLQEIITDMNIKYVKNAEVILNEEDKNTKFELTNISRCEKTYCKELVLSSKGVLARTYSLIIDEPNYAKSVRQQEQLSISIKVKNESDLPVYSTGTGSLSITPKNSNSELYHSSWVSPKIIANPSVNILPNTETVISATLSTPLLPGKYSDTIKFTINGKEISDSVKISFTVEKDNLKLAKIIPNGGISFANLRETPSLNGAIIGKVDAGAYVIVRKYDGAWVKIETKEGKIGWIYKPFVFAI